MASTTPAADPLLTLERLRKASSLHDIAHLLGFTPAGLAYVLYKIPPAARYKKFEIPKSAGGTRTIYAPREELKLLQRRLADRLLDCIKAIEQSSGRKDSTSHGFLPGKNTYTNASRHRRQRYVFNVDIRDFFTSINFGRVRGFFIKNKAFQVAPQAATVLAQIACHDPEAQGDKSGHHSFLPQGSPCSPVISNLIGNLLDRQLAGIAKQNGCHYSRYADDLTFSSSKPEFPVAIGRLDQETDVWVAGSALLNALEKAGFVLNDRKTRMQFDFSRQEVTGLVVNAITNTRPEYRRRVRAMVRSLTLTGEYVPYQEAKKTANLQKLAGMLGYVSHIDRLRNSADGGRKKRNELSSRERTYQRFLFYRHFYANDLPIILCEGKTDTIYLKFAFQALADKYPKFFSKDSSGKVKRAIRLFTHSEKYTGQLMGLSAGGVGDLTNFLRAYFLEIQHFKAPLGGPVIVLVDRDSGFKGKGGIFNTVKDLTKGVKPLPNQDFFYLGRNVYVLPTPLLGGDESKIEDFFDAETLSKEVGGKTFHKEGAGFDSSKNYSKQVFAMQVVLKMAGTIKFDGFSPLLDRFTEVLQHHVNLKTA